MPGSPGNFNGKNGTKSRRDEKRRKNKRPKVMTRPDACGWPPGRRMRLRLRRRVMSLSSLTSDGDAKRRRTKSGRASRLCGGTIDVVSLGNAPGLVTNQMELDFQVEFDDDVMLPDEEESGDVICVWNIVKGRLWSCSRGWRATPSCCGTGQKSVSRKW